MLLDASITEVLEVLEESFGDRLSEDIIVSMETAAVLLGMSPSDSIPVTLLYTKRSSFRDREELDGVVVEELDRRHTLNIRGFVCANHERAICDMLLYDRDPQVIVEAMCYYYYSYGERRDWGNLRQVASVFNVISQFESYIEDAIEHGRH